MTLQLANLKGDIIKIRINVESLDIGAAISENQQPFTALVTYAGRLSDHYVGGTESIKGGPFKVLISAELMHRKIKELEGKRVFAAEDLVSHSSPKYIGKFVSAWTEDASGAIAAKASGILDRNSEPDLVSQIIELARKGLMGFSYDLKDVHYELKASSDGSDTQYIELTDFAWRGATILRRDAAAYEETQLAASRTQTQNPASKSEDSDMTKEEIQAAIREGMQAAFGDFGKEHIDPLKVEIGTLKASIAAVEGKTNALEAAAKATPAAKTDDGKTKDDKGTAAAVAAAAGDGKQRVGITELATAMAEANKSVIEAVMKPMQAALDALTAKMTPEEKNGERQTLSVMEASVLKKYGDLKDGADPTVENYTSAIEMVQSDARLSKEAKGSMLRDLGAARRALLRAGTSVN